MEVDYLASDPYYLSIRNKDLTSRFIYYTQAGEKYNKRLEYYRLKGRLPIVEFGKKSDFYFELEFIPLGKLHILYTYGDIKYDRIVL